MSEEIANHSEESPNEVERDADTEAMFENFGLAPKAEKKDVQFPKMEEPTGDEEPPTTEEDSEPENPESKRTFKYKYNGEEGEVDEDEATRLIQKGMNHDKVQQRLQEQQQNLDRVAKLQGFKDHADLTANLDRLEKEQLQKQQDHFLQLRNDVRQDALDAGIDPSSIDAWLDNNPLLQEANRAIQERQALNDERANQEASQRINLSWQELYRSYPDLVEESQKFDRGETPWFYTPEMIARIDRGYDPKDAFELVHREKLQAQTKKAAEQKVIKNQQLGVRSHVDTNTATPPDEGSLLPVHYGLAEEFGVSLKGVQRQNQLLKKQEVNTMAFVWRQNTASRQPNIVSNILAKASTTFTYGQSLILVSGRWETAVAGAKVGGVYNGPTITTGANDFIDVIECTPNDIFVADYTGTPDATFLAGMETADIASGGVNLNAADVTGGAWAILSVDTANTKAIVRPKLRQLS